MVAKGRRAVFIATTSGPVRVLRVAEAARLAQSAACINLQARKAGISNRYHDFVSLDAGVVSAHTGRDSYRIDLSADIDQGDSWQLGVFCAHVLAHEELLAETGSGDASLDTDNTESIVWATGVLDVTLSVRPVSGVNAKISESMALFEHAANAGLPIRLLLPAASITSDVRERLESLGRSYPRLSWQGLDAIRFDLAELVPMNQEGKAVQRAFPLPRRSSVMASGLAALAVLTVIAVMAAVTVPLLQRLKGGSKLKPASTALDVRESPFFAEQTRSASTPELPEVSLLVVASPTACFDESARTQHPDSPKALPWGETIRIAVSGKPCYLNLAVGGGSPQFSLEARTNDTVRWSSSMLGSGKPQLSVKIYPDHPSNISLHVIDRANELPRTVASVNVALEF